VEVVDLRKNTEAYNLSRSELQFLIDQWIFNERHRLILSDRLFNGTTYERLAEKYDLSTQQVKNIVYKAMDRLEKHL
jgi:DNA-directed RNA polymerase sigma subunit (sigma70/sigma32)